MNKIEERINKMIKKSEVILNAGKQTNEEWLRSATFEEMAGTLYEWYSQGHIEGKVGKQLSSVTRVVEWLKQPHNNEVEK